MKWNLPCYKTLKLHSLFKWYRNLEIIYTFKENSSEKHLGKIHGLIYETQDKSRRQPTSPLGAKGSLNPLFVSLLLLWFTLIPFLNLCPNFILSPNTDNVILWLRYLLGADASIPQLLGIMASLFLTGICPQLQQLFHPRLYSTQRVTKGQGWLKQEGNISALCPKWNNSKGPVQCKNSLTGWTSGASACGPTSPSAHSSFPHSLTGVSSQ